MTDEEIKSPILEAVDRLKWLTVILFVLLALVTIVIFVVRSIDLAHVEESAVRNRAALCTLRGELKARILVSKGRLEERIDPERRDQIRAKIANQRETIDALTVIDCRDIGLRLAEIGGNGE